MRDAEVRYRMFGFCRSSASKLRNELRSYGCEFFAGEIAHIERIIFDLQSTAQRIKENERIHAAQTRAPSRRVTW